MKQPCFDVLKLAAYEYNLSLVNSRSQKALNEILSNG